MSLLGFIIESNRIEGIRREPTPEEIAAHEVFLKLPELRTSDFQRFVSVVQDGAQLRIERGMDVRVGDHYPPRGGPEIGHALAILLDQVNRDTHTPYTAHVAYETLHPFTDGNGRSGRALWLWMMHGQSPLGFLHQWYYQSLSESRHAR